MQTATISFDRNGKSIGWSANYPQGGMELAHIAYQAKKVKSEPFIPLGRKTMPQRQAHALNFFSEYVNERGYETREQAFHGARMFKPAQSGKKEKRSLIEKVIDFFYEYEGDENYG
jgi:hypothetical protein